MFLELGGVVVWGNWVGPMQIMICEPKNNVLLKGH